MTREKAIEIIKRAFSSWESEYRFSVEEDWSEEYEARDMAIKYLEQEPCDDCVSRADLISKLGILERRYGSDFYWETRKIVDKLSPVNPQEPKTGMWTNEKWHGLDLIGVTCSNCHVVESRFSKYCPNCGAKMEASKE